MHGVSVKWPLGAVARTSLVTALLVGGSFLLVAASAPSAHPAASLKVAQREFPPLLVAPGERVEVEYDTRTLPSARGFLYVRNDLQRAFTRVTLLRRKARGLDDKRLLLRGVVPARTVRGHWLYYYAVIHDRKSGRSVKVARAGLESVRVLTGAQIIKLGTHRFGQLRAPEAIVASAGPEDVAIGADPDGYPWGPSTFQVAADRSVWLLDAGYSNLPQGDPRNADPSRLVVWPPGQPNARPRLGLTIPKSPTKPWLGPSDFALGPAGGFYVRGAWSPELRRFTATGQLLWASATIGAAWNAELRRGPDGTLYLVGGRPDPRGETWVPVTTPGGRPLSRANQMRRTLHYQPLPGGLRLVSGGGRSGKGPCGSEPRETRFALINRDGRLLRAWRITSGTQITESLSATPALVGGDPVVVLLVMRPSGPAGNECFSAETEYLVLRLARNGPSRVRFSLAAASEEGKDQSGRAGWGLMVTDVRIGPGAKVYQLGSSPTVGVRIMRFSLK